MSEGADRPTGPDGTPPSTRAPNPPGERSQIALVIPTLDSADSLGDLGESIHRQELTPDEVLVIDSSNDNRTEGVANDWGLGVVRAKVSRIEARRIGALRSNAAWICLVDSDQVLDKRFIKELAVATRATNADAITAFELSNGEGRWRELLRVQDRVEFSSGEGLPRCWRREVFLAFDWGRLLHLPHVNGEDRLLRDWARRTGRRIAVAPLAIVLHQDPDLGPFLRKQYRNVRTGTGAGLPGALAPGVARSFFILLGPREVARATRDPLQFFGYYWMLMSRVVVQFAGLLAAHVAPRALPLDR